MKDLKKEIQELHQALKKFDKLKVDNYCAYVEKLHTDVNAQKAKKNPWAFYKTVNEYVDFFKLAESQELVIDGKHVFIQSIGLGIDYTVFKNKMLKIYPETKINFHPVYKDDDFSYYYEDSKLHYSHVPKSPFATTSDIIGCYCVIYNSRGQFMTCLSKADIEKHKQKSKMSSTWRDWYVEMVLKTVIKKACKYHFADEFEGLNEIDNIEIDVKKPVSAKPEVTEDNISQLQKQIDSQTTIKGLTELFKKESRSDEIKELFSKKREQLEKEDEK